MKTVLSMAPRIKPGQVRGSMSSVLTKRIQVTCRNPDCGKVFETPYPKQDHCSPKCQRRRAYLKKKAKENSGLLQRNRQEESGLAPRVDQGRSDRAGSGR